MLANPIMSFYFRLFAFLSVVLTLVAAQNQPQGILVSSIGKGKVFGVTLTIPDTLIKTFDFTWPTPRRDDCNSYFCYDIRKKKKNF
jgi:hypothetical protein